MYDISLSLKPGAVNVMPDANKLRWISSKVDAAFSNTKRVEYSTDINILLRNIKCEFESLGIQETLDDIISSFRDDVLNIVLVVENQLKIALEYWPDKTNFNEFDSHSNRDYTLLNIVNVSSKKESILLLTIWEIVKG